MNKSINYKLGRILAIVGIPMGGIAVLFLVFFPIFYFVDVTSFQVVYYCIMPFFLIVAEVYFLRMGFTEHRLKNEKVFWMFCTALFSLFFVLTLYGTGKEISFDNDFEISIEFYWGFFLVGSIGAIIQINRSKRSIHQQISNG